jgi:hypothetical protein
MSHHHAERATKIMTALKNAPAPAAMTMIGPETTSHEMITTQEMITATNEIRKAS